MRRARLIIAGIACVAAVLGAGTAAAKPPPGVVDDRRAELEDAEALWSAAAIGDYRYRIQLQCFCPLFRPATVRVIDGRPDETRRPYRRVNTVEKLFGFIRANLDNDGLTVRYSPLGVPREIASDPSFQIADEELFYSVGRFHRLTP